MLRKRCVNFGDCHDRRRDTASTAYPHAYKDIARIIKAIEQNYSVDIDDAATKTSDSLKPVAFELKLLKYDAEFQEGVAALKEALSRDTPKRIAKEVSSMCRL